VRSLSLENPILEAWRATLARRGDRAAILAADGTVVRSFRAIEAEAETLRRWLAPCAPESVIAVEIGNSASWPALLLALFRQRCIPLPLGSHFGGVERENALRTSQAAALITSHAGTLTVHRRSAVTIAWETTAPDFLKLTSGTTAQPRAIRFRAAQLLADCEQICATMGLTDGDLNYGAIPFAHSYGFSNLLTPLLCRGLPMVAAQDRMPRALLDGLERTRATVLPGMPVFFDKITQLSKVPALPDLRLCISAGAPLPAALGERFTQRFGRRVHTFYGASECGGIGYDRADGGGYEEGFVGSPMQGVAITGGDDAGAPITVRSAAVGDGYFPQADASTLGGGQFVPSDLIRWNARGMLLAGRNSDLINVAGRKLNPLEVEARIVEWPGVQQAVVFGIQSELRGEEPVACVAGAGLSREALLQLCRAHLSAWQIPRDIWIVTDIPVNERGKISRRGLAEQYRSLQRRG